MQFGDLNNDWMTHSRPLIIIIGSSLILDRETTTKGLLGTISGVIFRGKISFGRLVLEFCVDKKGFLFTVMAWRQQRVFFFVLMNLAFLVFFSNSD